MLRLLSRFLRALFQFSKHAAGEATKFGRSGVEFLGVVGVACLECDEPAAEAGQLIGRQLGDNFGDFFDFHVAQYSTAGAWLSRGRINLRPPMSASGQKQTSEHVHAMSALAPKADIGTGSRNVRHVPKADITRSTLQRSSLRLRSWRILSRGLKGAACIFRSCDA